VKTFLLAATVGVALLCTTNTADAQWLRRNRVYYSDPVPTASAYPVYGSGGVVTTGTVPTYTRGYIPGTLLNPGYYPPTNYYTSPNTFYPNTYYPSFYPSGVPAVGLRW
jgi:hypothetical protein